MAEAFNPKENYEKTKHEIGYVNRKQATQADYDRIGFMSGLEVHQQLLTKEKLFCRCPGGLFQKNNEYDAELIRHMRPTLSEMGEYDGTALMEFKTRKEIIYRIKHETTCTYEVDDTPPFPVNREALNIAIEISLLSKLNIVGEVHVTRKQYLDGSIPTGFQRTAIIGVEGELELPHKKIRLIQLSLEEDSCREISDIGHVRIYKTDRLGMPLIETVTYPDMVNPDEVKEVCNYIRFLNRSTGKVRTGMGAGRQDVNVSCKGGTRVEIKGVAHTRWIPELTHNEAFRQWALLNIRQLLLKKITNPQNWKISCQFIDFSDFFIDYEPIAQAKEKKYKLVAVNLSGFKTILSHFTQPEKMFADEISDRLKVIACLEKPNMLHSEMLQSPMDELSLEKIQKLLGATSNDAQILIWGPEADMKTSLETVEERCLMAFEGVPKETRKSFADGTTVFERVLPGADRMYPDTDSAPIPLTDKYIADLAGQLPSDVITMYHQLKKWNVPEDTFTYIFKKNLYPIIQRIVNELAYSPVFTAAFFGHQLKHIEGHYTKSSDFNYEQIYELFKFVKDKGLHKEIIKYILPTLYEHPKMDYESILTLIKFKSFPQEQILAPLPFLKKKFQEIRISKSDKACADWVMGELRKMAIGNISLSELKSSIEKN